MASTGLPASTWLIVAGAALLLVAGFVLYRTSRQH
jgi:LPXTG-motif cell wall-anchored protein